MFWYTLIRMIFPHKLTDHIQNNDMSLLMTGRIKITRHHCFLWATCDNCCTWCLNRQFCIYASGGKTDRIYLLERLGVNSINFCVLITFLDCTFLTLIDNIPLVFSHVEVFGLWVLGTFGVRPVGCVKICRIGGQLEPNSLCLFIAVVQIWSLCDLPVRSYG